MAAIDKIRLVNRDLVCRQYIAGGDLLAGDPVDVKASAVNTVVASDLDNSTAPVGFALTAALTGEVVSIVIGGKLYSPTAFKDIIEGVGALVSGDEGKYLAAHASAGLLTATAAKSLAAHAKVYAYVISINEIEVKTFCTGA